MGERNDPIAFRLPVSDGYWHRYGVVLTFLVLLLSAVAVAVAPELGDGVVVGVAFVGLSAGAVFAGLVTYNVVVAVLLAVQR
jgi:predicted Na+-dependent transporter